MTKLLIKYYSGVYITSLLSYVMTSQTHNQIGSESYLVNTKVYKAKFSLLDVSVNAKEHY